MKQNWEFPLCRELERAVCHGLPKISHDMEAQAATVEQLADLMLMAICFMVRADPKLADKTLLGIEAYMAEELPAMLDKATFLVAVTDMVTRGGGPQ